MRKSREEAAETRERIVDTAAHEFGQHGIAETGLADVMAAVGLTHGGFYKHFESKGQLVAEAIEKSMDSQRLSMEKAKGDEALEAIVKAYVSSTHRDNTEEVCPVAALGSELHRADERTRDAASRGIVRLISLIESRLTYLSPKEAKSRAHAILAAMVGSVVLSRIVLSPKLSDSLLRDTREFIIVDGCHVSRHGPLPLKRHEERFGAGQAR